MISGSETWLMKVRRELMLDRIEINMIRFVQFAVKGCPLLLKGKYTEQW